MSPGGKDLTKVSMNQNRRKKILEDWKRLHLALRGFLEKV